MTDDDLEQEVADAKALAKQAMQYAGEMQDRVEELEEEVYELRKENERLRDQDELFRRVRQNMQDDPEQRAVVLIKTLNNEALTNKDLDEPALASMTKDEAKKALQGSATRHQIYRGFEEADRLVEDDSVLEYKRGDPGRGGDAAQLRLNLEAGDLPEVIAGEPIRQEPFRGEGS